jgi:ribonuclease P protein component
VLPAKYRLTRSEDFRRVHGEGRSWANRMLVLCKLPRGENETRFGFSVSRRLGKAVVRNRIKRLLREAVHKRLTTVVPGWDIVFIARQGVVGASFSEVDHAVVHLMGVAGLLQKDRAAEVGKS